VGHTLGLSHDGIGSSQYYAGHNDWAPIMGIGEHGPAVPLPCTRPRLGCVRGWGLWPVPCLVPACWGGAAPNLGGRLVIPNLQGVCFTSVCPLAARRLLRVYPGSHAGGGSRALGLCSCTTATTIGGGAPKPSAASPAAAPLSPRPACCRAPATSTSWQHCRLNSLPPHLCRALAIASGPKGSTQGPPTLRTTYPSSPTQIT
jgi:hypothetical protein